MRKLVACLLTVVLLVGAAPTVSALDVSGGTVDVAQETDGSVSIATCDEESTLSTGPDFETTSDETVRFVADVAPGVDVASYEWRDGYGKRGKGKGPGDQVLSTQQSFETTLDPGKHTITLTVETEDGETITDTVSAQVRGKSKGNGDGAQVDSPPIADAGDCRMVIANEDTRLNGSGSYDRDGTIEAYEWDLDANGTTDVTGETPTVQFEELGNRTVELTVTDDAGQTDNDTVGLFVNDRPHAAFDHSPARPNPDETVTFDATDASDTLGGIDSYRWDLDGDGEYETSGESVAHAFDAPGDHEVTLQVTDAYGVSNTTATTVHVNHPPTADANRSERRVNVSEAIAFDGTASTDPEDGIERYEWDVDGDGVFEATGETVTHVYDTPGDRNVTLRVTDAGGLTDTDTVQVAVNAPPEADASRSDRLANVSEELELDGTASSDDSEVTRYEWDLDGDGTFDEAGETITNAYDTPGERKVTLRVTDDWGVTDTDTITVRANAPPEADATSSADSVEVGQSVTFDATGSTDDTSIESYEWDLDGDGTTDATGGTVDHAFDEAGDYTVTVTVTDDLGVTDTATASVSVVPAQVEEDETTLPSGPVDAVGASATGDPHITTFDGHSYDFQGAGEFVMARALEGSLSVQGRLAPVSSRPVSVIEAIATSLDGHDVTIDAADGTPLVVDGTRHALGTSERLDVGSGAVYRRGSKYVVVYPGDDGEVDAGDERLTVRMRGNRVDIWLTLRADRSGSVEGLLGTPAGSEPDVALADGTAVSPSDYDELYGPFRDDWRVDSETSHFHYESGESLESFYDPDYPDQLLTVDDLSDEERSAAEQAALDAGLEPGTAVFENAVLDYATTEDDTYLASAATSQPSTASFAVEAGSSFEAGVGDAVTFVASVHNESASDVTVEWRFGDGETATGAEVAHTFDAAGDYTVTVTATGPDGGVARDTMTVTAAENATTVQSPVPDVQVTRPNATHARLDASGSADPDGSVVGLAWDTDGDGEADDHGSTTSVALEPTAREVTLAVVDDDGNRATNTVHLEGLNDAPTAEAGPDRNATPGEPVEFDASGSSDPDGDELTYEWAFGDGSTATGVAPTHEYEVPGTYTVTVTATDEHGATDTDTTTVTVFDDSSDGGPTVGVSANRTTIEPGDAVAFDADADGWGLTYSWSFGDGATGSGASVSHVYDAPGKYVVELTVTDGAGRTATGTTNVVVFADPRFESFEDGLGEWSVNDGGFRKRGPSTHGGYSAGNRERYSSGLQARWNAYDGGDQPRKFSFYYRETGDSNGGGLRVKNSDGNVEVGFATDNPQWNVYDADGSEKIYGGDGYRRWVYVEFTFDWENDEYVLYVEDQKSGSSRIHTGDLRQGTDVESVEVVNWHAGSWRSNEAFYMWVDAVAFEDVDLDIPRPDPRATSTRQRGDNYRLSDAEGSGGHSYVWEYGDRLMQSGVASPVHRYERSGTYTAKVSVRNEYGLVNRDTVTLRVNQTDDYHDSFEHGVRTWAVNDGGFRKRGPSVHGGYSAGNRERYSSGLQARDTVYPDGHQPRKFSFYYRETSDSNGGGLRVKNSNGDVEVGFATDNPQWNVYDADGSKKIYGGDGYRRWVYVEFTFDWENDEYVLYVEDQKSGTSRTYTGDLRQGADIESVEVVNWHAGSWRSNEAFYMWIDSVSFESVSPDDSWPEVDATATHERGDIVGLANATDDNYDSRTHIWEFGDGLKQQSAAPSHKYERPGTYTAKVSVRDDQGRVTRDTVTLEINRTDDYHESFEHGLRTWAVNDGGFRKRGPSVHGGYSAGNREDYSSGLQARDTVYPDGHQPRKFSFYYRETGDSNGGGLRVKNSDGNVEVGFATDNPQWNVYDADGSKKIYGGDGYRRWVYVEFTFDWENDEYTVYVEDQKSGSSRLYTGELRQGTDVESVEVVNWHAGSWRSNEAFHMWVDGVSFESVDPDDSWPEVDATATHQRGDIVQLSNATDPKRSERSYHWEYGDGIKQQGATLDHKYERPGTYTAKVSVRDDQGRVTRDTVTFRIEPTDDYHESFEHGLRTWAVNDGGFRKRGPSVHGGYSAGNRERYSSGLQARDTVYPGGHEPETFSFYYRETSDSNGGGLRVKNSDGNVEVGFATDNPQWNVYDADGSTQIYGGDGYRRWVYVEFTFDWANDQYTVYVEDQSSGTSRTYTGDLRQGTDVETVEVVNWHAGSWRSNEAFYMWVDAVSFEDGN